MNTVPSAPMKAFKWLYHDTFVRLAHKYQMVPMWWDNGNDQFDRAERQWRDPVVKEIVIQAGRGVPNAIIKPADLLSKRSKHQRSDGGHSAERQCADWHLSEI
ncbi:hypothetical protein PO124_00380 [Bacillus licheniformis]|nr:hypothetical protein [Bacillus licheniformis]